jgi:hypothetical protein
MAVFADHTGTARFLLEVGADPNLKDDDSETVFQCALRHASQETIALIKNWPEKVTSPFSAAPKSSGV